MNQKECLVVKFSEGLGIFDQHYGYPQIDDQEIYEGPTGKVVDIQGIQAHAGRDFFVPEGKEFSIDIYQCPYLQIAIKAEPGTNTCLFLRVHERKHVRNQRFVVIGKTPQGDCRLPLMSNHFTIKDDNKWHEYVYDLRTIRGEKDDNIYHQPICQDAGSIREIRFYAWTGSGTHTFHFNNLVCKSGLPPHIKSITVSPTFAKAGDQIEVTVIGESGGHARFSIADVVGATDVPLEEKPDDLGTYSGIYTVKVGDDVGNAIVTVVFTAQSGEEISRNAEQSVTIDTTSPKISDANVTPGVVSNDQTVKLKVTSEPNCQVIADISELDTTQSKIMLTEGRIAGIYQKESRVSTSNEASNGIKNIKIIATNAVGNVSDPYVITVKLNNPEPESFIVRGIVVTNVGVAAKGLKVVAIDKNPGKDVVLGETITDSSGNYTISYKKEALQKVGKQKADIEIKIVDPEDESKIYGTSAVHFNADKDEEINLVLQTESVEKRSEYLQITSDLKQKIGEVAFKDLQENKDRQDISYLANKTGWDARLVAMVSLADKYRVESGIPAEFYYALFRAGVSTDADGLYRTNSETVKKIWEKAIEENIIEASLKPTIEQNLAKFKETGRTHLLENAKPVGVSSLKELLDISLPDISRQREFVELYFNHVGDMSSFWANAETKFGKDTADKLQLDGKLGYLTVNNAELIGRIRSDNLVQKSPDDLIKKGLYKTEAWDTVFSNGIPVPKDMPGETDEEKKSNYINYMVFMLKISYPTSVVAEMVNNDELTVNGGAAVKEEVYQFLQDGKFEIGVHPVEKFITDNNIELGKEALNETKRLQRVYQVSPSDNAMKVLVDNSLDSALSIVQYDEKEFIETFKDELGEDIAKMTYVKANQVHSTVLNVATSYLTYRTSPRVYAISGAKENVNPHDPDLISYPTLEELFGSMDYCTCGHCKSVLSPAAYLVDLLQFIDRIKVEKENPIDVLLERRPDIKHIQLTCENTNTVLPYIDLVNEILEYYVVNQSLTNFEGHNVEEITSAELLASPQFVNDQAYTTLKEQVYPFNLPFNQLLEALRLYYDYLQVPLHEAMEKLRVNDNFEIPGGAGQPPYAWREIYNEFLGISQEEYKVLTDSGTIKLPVYFGEDKNMAFDDFNDKFSNAKVFSRKTGITYNELIELIKTHFVNPTSHLIPKLEKLRISFADIKKFEEGNLSNAEFENKIPAGLDTAIYGGDVKRWVRNNYNKIMSLILLTVPEGEKTECEFDKAELRYSLPDNNQNLLKEIDYWRLLRFIRLWRKLGWTIEGTDKAITALYKAEFKLGAADSIDTQKQKLDKGFKDLVVKIAHVKRIRENLTLKKESSLIKLLVLWSNIDTHGDNSLYKQMFLHSSILKIDTVFYDNGYGEYLMDPDEKIKGHLLALQAAFNVTAEELSFILDDVDFDENSPLSLEYVSKIYRYSLLAKALKISIPEFITLKTMSGMDPFHELEDVHPSTLKFIELVQLIKQSNFKINTLSYFLQHEDVTGKASPSRDSILSLAKTLKDGLVGIEQDYIVEYDPTGEIAKSKMALVYENAVVDMFFGLLKDTTSYSVDYSHPQPELELELKDIRYLFSIGAEFEDDLNNGIIMEQLRDKFKNEGFPIDENAEVTKENGDNWVITDKKIYIVKKEEGKLNIYDITDKITYNHFQKRLIYQGVMTEGAKTKFENAASATDDFKDAIQKLYDMAQDDFSDFFDKYSDLKALYDSYVASNKPENEKIADILESFLPTLKKEHKHLFIKQTLSSLVNVDLTILNELLEKPSILHSIEQDDQPAIEDFLKLEGNGVTAQYFFADSTATDPDKEELIQARIDFSKDGKHLPTNPAGADAKISAIWRFYLEVPVNGNYDYYIETDNGAEVKISIDENGIPIKDVQGIWQNKDAIELKAGRLYRVELEIAKVRDKAILKWESNGIEKQTIPLKCLYPYEQVRNFSDTYIRLLKAIGIFERLGLEEKEIAFFCTATSFLIDGKGFLNAIPVTWNPDGNKVEALFPVLLDLLRYVELKRSLKVNDETLVTILNDPDAKVEYDESLLLKVTGWDESSYEDLLERFEWVQADLSDLNKFIRLNEAFEVVKEFGVPAANLINWTTNQPVADPVRDIQNTLRAKYDESVWLTALQPINDKLRSCQRDALVSYILHEMQKNDATENIDTPDKLFEYFFIDVEMDPCMKTSRIKQANSTVQLFIQRCLMNLEPEVSPASIKADQWEWMKRYRVWEANRKIFLYPENWLEPELRDNKSPFFRDLESELLQADITDDLAETALLNYLEKLDDVSKLEISGMYLQEDKDILHVFGRTTGASRKYYYRYFDGNWTPWEKVDLDIEDNPILPVVWKDRLFLFWLNIVRKGPEGNELPESEDGTGTLLTDLKTDVINQNMLEEIEINLSWSEYYNNKWQPRKTSDFNVPFELDYFGQVALGIFKREDIEIFSSFDDSGLRVHISYHVTDPQGNVKTIVSHTKNPFPYFKLFNKHSTPNIELGFISDFRHSRDREFYKGYPRNKLNIKYYSHCILAFKHEVLKIKKPHLYDIVETHHKVITNLEVTNIFEAPFFYQDKKHVFYVKPEESLTTVPESIPYGGLCSTDPIKEITVPRIWEMPDIIGPDNPWFTKEFPWVETVGTMPADLRLIDFLNDSVSVNKVVLDNRAVTFGDERIGPMGSQHARLPYNNKIGKSNFEAINIKGVIK